MRYDPEGKVTSAHIIRKSLKGKNIILHPLGISDCTDEYVEWLNDPEINRYLETKWEEQTRDTIEIFLEEMEKSENSVLFGIFFDGKHVGNIKIGPVNWHHLYADVSYFIGDRSTWNQGKFINESKGSKGKFCEENFSYNSKTNSHFLTVDELRELIENLN